MEDLTTYIKVDPNNLITVTPNNASFVGLSRNEDAYVYKDKGINHFDGDFEHLLDIHINATDTNGTAVYWALANIIDDANGVITTGEYEIGLGTYKHHDGNFYIRLFEIDNGIFYMDNYIGNTGITYYLKIKKDESVGDYGTLYSYIYSNPEQTNLLDTLSIPLKSKIDFRYIYAVQSFNDGELNETQSGYTANLGLQEEPVIPDPSYIAGTVIDQSSGLPISGVTISANGYTTTTE